jgi:hypothetical protein
MQAGIMNRHNARTSPRLSSRRPNGPEYVDLPLVSGSCMGRRGAGGDIVLAVGGGISGSREFISRYLGYYGVLT